MIYRVLESDSYPGGSRTRLSMNHFQFAPDPHAALVWGERPARAVLTRWIRFGYLPADQVQFPHLFPRCFRFFVLRFARSFDLFPRR